MVEISATDRVTLDVRDLSRAFSYATDWLSVFVEEVNALNVYPVPDGDTGTNMHLTMQSVRRQIADAKPVTMAQLAHALSYGSLLGARGNSGVILSQVLKGFADSIKPRANVDGRALAAALHAASKTAYAAVMRPVEGTILTVVRASADAATEAKGQGPVAVLHAARAAAAAAVQETPEQLPLLKQAGVVDAGGLGYMYILDGILGFLEGVALPPKPVVARAAQQDFEEQEFGFCTEFLLADVKVPTADIRELVAPYGDSLLVVGAEGFVKGHIHTEEPEKLLAEVARFGRMVRSKVEDMSEQHSEILSNLDLAQASAPRTGLVAVSHGYGVTKVFRSLGARVVVGGQTDNPSVEDIADAVRSLGASDVIILANNKNVVMAAQRVNEIVSDKRVEVLPTNTLGEGLAAAVVFQESDALDDVMEAMRDAAEHALTLEVTTASRSLTIEGVSVKEGDFIGLADGDLKVSESSPAACLLAMLTADSAAAEFDVASLFYSASITPAEVEEVAARISERFPALELDIHAGAPELYPYLMLLE